MKQLIHALKSAHRVEIWIIIAMLCVLLVLGMGRQEVVPSASEDELRMQRLLSRIEGAGRVTVMLARNADGTGGCVVASSGAGDVRVMLELQRTVQALTGLQLDRIEIVKSE